MVYWGVIWCVLIKKFDCKCYALKNVFYSLKPANIRIKVSKMSMMSVILKFVLL